MNAQTLHFCKMNKITSVKPDKVSKNPKTRVTVNDQLSGFVEIEVNELVAKLIMALSG